MSEAQSHNLETSIKDLDTEEMRRGYAQYIYDRVVQVNGKVRAQIAYEDAYSGARGDMASLETGEDPAREAYLAWLDAKLVEERRQREYAQYIYDKVVQVNGKVRAQIAYSEAYSGARGDMASLETGEDPAREAYLAWLDAKLLKKVA